MTWLMFEGVVATETLIRMVSHLLGRSAAQ